jgi:hypothetical protein
MRGFRNRRTLSDMNIIFLALFFAAATPDELVKAIRAQDAPAVQSILEADPTLVNGKPVTAAIFILVNKESFMKPADNRMLQLILSKHPKLDLWQTAALGTPEELAKMLKPDQVNAMNEFGWTPLHMAAFGGNVANTKLLLDRGADMRIRAKTKFKNSPFLAGMLTSDYETIKLLLDRGADVLERQGEGDTALHEAASMGNMQMVKLLVERGSDVLARDDEGKSPLDYAIEKKHEEVAEFLRAKGGR